MKTLTGFYNTHILTKNQQKKLMKEAIFLSYDTHVESKYVREGRRTIEPDITIKEALELCTDLKMVDRSIQACSIDDRNGELSLITTSFYHPNHTYDKNYPTSGWLLLYCFMSLENLQKLAKKYKLTME